MDTDRLAASLAAKVDAHRIMQLTLDMVRIPSPPGRERAVSEFYAAELREAGLDVELDSEFPDSPSVVAWLRGGNGGPALQLDGHTDTVDLPGPDPRFEAGYIHGRGSEDMKASLAAMAEAARILCEAGVQLRGDLLLTAHGRHESATNETLISLIEKGVHGDAVIVTELGGKDLAPDRRGDRGGKHAGDDKSKTGWAGDHCSSGTQYTTRHGRRTNDTFTTGGQVVASSGKPIFSLSFLTPASLVSRASPRRRCSAARSLSPLLE